MLISVVLISEANTEVSQIMERDVCRNIAQTLTVDEFIRLCSSLLFTVTMKDHCEPGSDFRKSDPPCLPDNLLGDGHVATFRVPEDTQDQVILFSCRRCCVCFGLFGNVDVKAGQIAHLDHDNKNDELDNLAFLCLDHHDQYDSRTSQSTGLRENEIKEFRKELYNNVSAALSHAEEKFLKLFGNGNVSPENGPSCLGPSRRFSNFSP